ncbi:MAG: DUF5615 family PIN-like protein [Flavobacteriales bacterium]|nr:DUF5615 family PIN-like protein [Flavobacteriales bacterium]
MTIWLDAQLSPVLANWIRSEFNVKCFSIRDIGNATMYDETLFSKAKGVADVIITKDVDLVNIVKRLGPPPGIIWLRMGNTSTAHLKQAFAERLPEAL